MNANAQVKGDSKSLPTERKGEGVNTSTLGVSPHIPRYHPGQTRVPPFTGDLTEATPVQWPPRVSYLQTSTPQMNLGDATDLMGSDSRSGSMVKIHTALSKKLGRQVTYGDH